MLEGLRIRDRRLKSANIACQLSVVLFEFLLAHLRPDAGSVMPCTTSAQIRTPCDQSPPDTLRSHRQALHGTVPFSPGYRIDAVGGNQSFPSNCRVKLNLQRQ